MSTRITLSQHLRKILKDAFGDTYKKYFIGDPVQIPQQDLPCIIIEKERSTVNSEATGVDRRRTPLTVKIVVNKKDDISKRPQELLWRHKLELMMEGIDDTTGDYLNTSILGVIRSNFTLSGRINYNVNEITYGLQPRPQQFTEEAHLLLTVDETIIVGQRT
jgi:hypothetical protein